MEEEIKLALYGAGCTQSYAEEQTKELCEIFKRQILAHRKLERSHVLGLLNMKLKNKIMKWGCEEGGDKLHFNEIIDEAFGEMENKN
jgi:hypothetical protein